MIKILLIEDEKPMAQILLLELTHEGYEVDVCYDGKLGYEKAMQNNYDLILLDLMLPNMSGFEICRKLRKSKQTPIIMLTARSEVSDKVNGLDLGADDYLTKPFAIEELFARIRVIMRHEVKEKQNILQVGDLILDSDKKSVERAGRKIDLTKKEYELLEYLMINKEIVISREKMIEKVWGYDYVSDTKMVDVLIRYLRSKIDDPFETKFIHTVRGFGYVLKED